MTNKQTRNNHCDSPTSQSFLLSFSPLVSLCLSISFFLNLSIYCWIHTYLHHIRTLSLFPLLSLSLFPSSHLHAQLELPIVHSFLVSCPSLFPCRSFVCPHFDTITYNHYCFCYSSSSNLSSSLNLYRRIISHFTFQFIKKFCYNINSTND